MKSICSFCIVALSLGMVALPMARADDFKPEPGYISLFNGKDLTGGVI